MRSHLGRQLTDAARRLKLVELLKESCDKGPGHGPRQARTNRQLRQPSRATVRVEGDVRTGSNGVGAAVEEPAHADTVVSQAHDNSIGINGAALAGEAAIGHVGTPYAARRGERRTEDWPQVDRRMADDSALRNAGGCVVKQEMPDGAVTDGIRREDTSVGMFGAHGVSEAVEAGRRVANGRSGDVSEWETVYAQDTRAPAAPAARAVHAGLSRTQAARVQRFLQQVSLHMRLVSRQERLLPYRVAHQDRWRSLSLRNRRR